MCGIVGVIGTERSAREVFLGLTTLQHRGQDAAGILTSDEDGFHRVRAPGLVESVFNRANMESLRGSAAIGHARYSTAGSGDVSEAQPLVVNYPYGIGIVHNGNLVNSQALRAELLKDSRRMMLTKSDTEVALNLLADSLEKTTRESSAKLTFDELCEATRSVMKRLRGSYSFVVLIQGQGILAIRDPLGIRPLCLGSRAATETRAKAWMVASETAALALNGYTFERDLMPGEVLFLDGVSPPQSRVIDPAPRPAHCMFEWVYFASPESTLDGAPVYASRIELGKSLIPLVKEALSKKGKEIDLVIPIPETSRIAAISLAEGLGVPYRELLIKNRYIQRTFILDTQEKRQSAVGLKLAPVRSEIEGKRVLLVDDSIVRGTTSKRIVELVRNAGATEVTLVSTCPPIRHPCFYGIDFPEEAELLANRRSETEIERELGADLVVYQTLEGLSRAIHTSAGGETPLCRACLDGKYPTSVEGSLALQAERGKTRSGAPR